MYIVVVVDDYKYFFFLGLKEMLWNIIIRKILKKI